MRRHRALAAHDAWLIRSGPITLLFIAGLIVLAGVLLFGSGAVLRRRRGVQPSRAADLPPLIFRVQAPSGAPIRPAVFGRATPRATAQAVADAEARPAPASDQAATIRFERMADRPLQFLPGRLEVEAGLPRGQEIRFVRLDDGGAVFTLGRADGPPHRHVKLPADTVSRQQATMEFADGQWRIVNLSQTNPTVVNGEELDRTAASSRWLRDGDRIEMGELVFRFRER